MAHIITSVEQKDRKDDIEYLRMALNIVEIGVSYEQADLINRTVNKARLKKGKLNLHDGVSLLHQWKQEWQNYWESKKKESEKK